MRKAHAALAMVLPALTAAGVLALPANAATPTDQPGVSTVRATCNQGFHPSVGGGKAAWNITCSGGTIRVQGWVKDTAADGKAAEVYGIWGDNATFPTQRAGGTGKVVKFDKKHAGTRTVILRLRVI